MTETLQEQWKFIPEFPKYKISSLGRVYNTNRDMIMSTSVTNHGHPKITLTDYDGKRYTRSLTLLVAEAFVPGKDYISDQVIVLDGDLNNVEANNLAWRPRWFAWKYAQQLRRPQPPHYQNLCVENMVTGKIYESIVHAGVSEGLLFSDIWRSTYTGHTVYPNESVFEVIERV